MSAVAYECGIERLGTGPTVPLSALVVRERAAGLGWSGWGRVRQADSAPAAILHARARSHGLVPGAPVTLSLSPAGRQPVRSWPSVLADLEVNSDPGSPREVIVRFADPLTQLADRRVHGVFAGRSPPDIVAGALARAAGVAGAAAAAPRLAHPSFPAVVVLEGKGAGREAVPYAIASGEPLLAFIRRFLGGIGLGILVRDDASDAVRLELMDGEGEPDCGTTIALRLTATCGSETGEGILGIRKLAAEVAPWKGIAGPDSGSGTGSSPGTTPEAGGWVPEMFARSEEPELRSGGRIELTNDVAGGVREWRIVDVTHRVVDRGYRNASRLGPCDPVLRVQRGAGAPAPAVPRTLTGSVDEEGLVRGAPVPVDEHGRIPVRIACDPLATVRLPLVVPSAGAVHGFVPVVRQGDRVRVRVCEPVLAEVRGALWSEALAAGEEAIRSTHAMQIASGLGVAFHPADRMSEFTR